MEVPHFKTEKLGVTDRERERERESREGADKNDNTGEESSF